MPRCKDCKYWDTTRTGGPNGHCHRLPPEVVTITAGYIQTMWPETKPDDWCGEGSKPIRIGEAMVAA